MTQNFRKEIVEIASQDNAATAVYQLNIQLFPLIEIARLQRPRNEESHVERGLDLDNDFADHFCLQQLFTTYAPSEYREYKYGWQSYDSASVAPTRSWVAMP